MSDTTQQHAPAETPQGAIDAHADEQFDLDALTQDILGKKGDAQATPDDDASVDAAVAATVPPEGAPEGATYDETAKAWRGPDGKFVSAKAEAEPPGSEPADPPPTEAATPEATTTATPQEGAPKAAPFAVHGIDAAALSGVEVEFKVAGKDVRVPLDRVVRMAQSGGYNEQLQAEVKEARDLLPQWQQYGTTLEQRVQQMEQAYARLLADPSYYVAEAERYEQQNTPEARLAAVQRENEALRQQQVERESTAQLLQGAQALILPKFEQLLQQYPAVTGQELAAHLETLIRPYRAHGGAVHPQHLPAVADLLDRALAPYAQSLHEQRSLAQTLEQQAQSAATAAQEAAQRARAEAEAKANAQVARVKRDVAREIAPVGRTQAVSTPKAPPRNANEAAQRALDNALASVGVT